MDWKEIYDENDTFEQCMHDTLVLIGMAFKDIEDGKSTPSKALYMVGNMISTFASYALAHMEDENKYHRQENN